MIDTWEKANTNLLNLTFDKLDDFQQKIFRDVTASMNLLNGNLANHLEATMRISELGYQIVQDARIFDGKMAVLRYAPRVAYPSMPEIVPFTVRGVNMDDAKPDLLLPDGTAAKRTSLTKQEAVYEIPSKLFKFGDTIAAMGFKIRYTNPSTGIFGWIKDSVTGRSDVREADIMMLQLPKALGTYSLETTTKDLRPDYYSGSREFHWSGRDENHTDNQDPHANGWRMVIASLHEVQQWGEAGRGCHVVTNNANGFQIEVRVGRISTFLNPNAPGYQHCIFSWKEVIDVEEEHKQAPLTGKIMWNSDVTVPLPPNRKTTIIGVTTWDGMTRSNGGTSAEKFYRLEELKDQLIIKPLIPTDLNTF